MIICLIRAVVGICQLVIASTIIRHIIRTIRLLVEVNNVIIDRLPIIGRILALSLREGLLLLRRQTPRLFLTSVYTYTP